MVFLIAGVFVLAIALWFALTMATLAYAAQNRTVVAPDGTRFDVLVNRERVPLFTLSYALANWISVWPILVGVARNRGWRQWRWAVTVRQSPYGGRPDLLREIFNERPTAEARAESLAEHIAAGATDFSTSGS